MTVSIDASSADEQAVLEVFRQHGADGRAITPSSLGALSPFKDDRPRLSAALKALKAQGIVVECGVDALTQRPMGYRLVPGS